MKLYFSDEENKWKFTGLPLLISLLFNSFISIFIIFYSGSENKPLEISVTLSPIEQRISRKKLKKKKKLIQKKIQKIKKKIKKQKKLIAKRKRQLKQKAKQNRARSRQLAKSNNSSEENYTAPRREQDYRPRTSGMNNPGRRRSMLRNNPSENPSYTSADDIEPNYSSKSWKSSEPAWKEVGNKEGPSKKKGWRKGPAKGRPSGKNHWGGQGAKGSYLVFSSYPAYPKYLQKKGVVVGNVKARIYFSKDGKAIRVIILSNVDAALSAVTRRKLLNWRASPGSSNLKRFVETNIHFDLD